MLKIVLAIALVAILACLAVLNLHRFGGQYILRDSDHAEVMVAAPSSPSKTLRILFVGNSITFVNDLPAMVVNLAASDPGNTTRLEIKAETYPDAHLGFLQTNTEALSWARAHHVDYVVLQEHSGWYEDAAGTAATTAAVSSWVAALRALNETPLLFEIWSDGVGSTTYTDQRYSTFGLTPDDDAANASKSTRDLARQMGVSVVGVGTAFAQARHTQGAPELLGPDHHHPSVAGTYLAALVFYRAFTGRTGTEAQYRPWGMAKADAEMLAKINAE